MKDNRRSVAPEITKREVLEVAFIRGENTENNPSRFVRRYTDLEGNTLAEYDPFLDDEMNEIKKKENY